MPAENVSTTTDLSGRTSTSRFHASINQLGSGYLRCETENNNIKSTSKSRSSHSTVRILATGKDEVSVNKQNKFFLDQLFLNLRY